ncbi:MAG: hypothetical protein EBZ91_08305 [Gammaproteobacteria bacterium]|nr:hypothetical protein [Gammaproteobacteria bacterium]
MTYHTRFRRIDRRTKDATKRLVRGWSQLQEWERVDRCQAWLHEVSGTYGMRPPQLVMAYEDPTVGSGCYFPVANRLCLPHASIVTLLHEFRHAMQAQGKAGRHYRAGQALEARGGAEDDARAWSLSLYWTVAPRSFRRMVGAGRILFITTDDLTSV